MQCKEIEAVLAQQGFVPVPDQARAHLAGCTSCQSLVADLTAIVATAHLLPAEVDPPRRVWTSLRRQLEAEGIIRPAREPWWRGFSELLRARALATAAIAALALFAMVLQLRQPDQSIAQASRAKYDSYLSDTASILSRDEASLPAIHLASAGNGVNDSLRRNLNIVDNFIVDCEQRLKEEPDDQLARDYLAGAYQQKAELISVMMERGETEY